MSYGRCANGESQILILFFWFVVYLNQTIWLKPVGHTSPSPSAPLTLEITISLNFLRFLLLVKKFHICWLECKVNNIFLGICRLVCTLGVGDCQPVPGQEGETEDNRGIQQTVPVVDL